MWWCFWFDPAFDYLEVVGGPFSETAVLFSEIRNKMNSHSEYISKAEDIADQVI